MWLVVCAGGGGAALCAFDAGWCKRAGKGSVGAMSSRHALPVTCDGRPEVDLRTSSECSRPNSAVASRPAPLLRIIASPPGWSPRKAVTSYLVVARAIKCLAGEAATVEWARSHAHARCVQNCDRLVVGGVHNSHGAADGDPAAARRAVSLEFLGGDRAGGRGAKPITHRHGSAPRPERPRRQLHHAYYNSIIHTGLCT